MKLKTKLILIYTVITAILLVCFIYYINIYIGGHLRKEVTNGFRILAETSEGAYFAFTENSRIRTKNLSSDNYIVDTTQYILASKDEEEAGAFTEELNAYLQKKILLSDFSIMLVDILDKNGVVIASSRPERVGEDESDENIEFNRALAGELGDVFISNMVVEKDESVEPMMHSSTRLYSFKNYPDDNPSPIDAVMLIHFSNAEQLHNILTGDWQLEKGAISAKALTENYDTAEVYLVNTDKFMITPSRFNKNSVLSQKVDTLPVRMCFDDVEEMAGEYISYSGKNVIGASMCIKRDNIALIVEAESEEVLLPLKSVQTNIIYAGALTLFFGAVLVGISSRFLLSGLTKLFFTAKIVSGGDLSARTDIKSRDEIGQLAKIFNEMLSSIQQSQKELKETDEELRSVNERLEERVTERTSELEALKADLENMVREQTEELKSKLDELERFKKLTVGRELQMLELKKEIARLKNT